MKTQVSLLSKLAFAFAMCGVSATALAGLPSEDANIATLRNSFQNARGFRTTSTVTKSTWNCFQFSAMKDIGANSKFTRTFTAFGNVLVTEAAFSDPMSPPVKSTGSVQLTNGVIWGGITGTTDGFVFPYDSVAVYIRQQPDGTLIEEWTANPKAMVVSLRHGLSVSTLFADQWMEPSLSDPNRVAFVYAVCRPQ